MSKPELPKKIDPLPAPKPAEAKPVAAKKTGWEPPSPQKQRVSERKLGMLLAVCLLVALGFVAYRKFHSNQLAAAAGAPLAQFGKLPPDDNGKSLPADGGAAQPLPTADLGGPADERLMAHSSARPTPADSGFFSSASPPDQAEPVAASPGSSSTPTFEPGTTNPPVQTESETQAVDESSNPFFASAGSIAETSDEAPVEAGDPFTSAGVAANDANVSTFSSDATSEFGAPVDSSASEPATELTFGGPPTQSEPEPSQPEVATSTPVVGLFGQIEPVEEPQSESAAEPASASPSLAASPWGAGTIETGDAAELAESEPPLIEPNDPQVMPTLTLGPFEGSAADSATSQAPVESEPSPLDAGFNPYPAATADSPVPQRAPVDAPPEDPFPAGEGTTVVERAVNPLHDPFTPARDVQHAIREDAVVVHDVQSGDNFWNIARQHYGSGKYFTALAAYNQKQIPDPRRIRPGMQVHVPSATVLAQQFPQLVSGGATVPYAAPPDGPPGFALDAHGRPCYRISKGDTLSDIAQKHLGRASRWRQIFGMNIDQLTSADSLTTGMVLRLPADATQIRMDAAGIGRR